MGKIVIDTNNLQYKAFRKAYPRGKHNGAYYYAKELEQYFVPIVKTERNWDLLGMKMTPHHDHSIIFIHQCINWDMAYPWLEKLKDAVLVVSTWPTYEWAKERRYRPVFLPLSIDVNYVKKFTAEKTKGACYAGNRWKFKEKYEATIPDDVEFPPEDLPRSDMLKFMAPYKELYAIGRCALEGKVLGCEIKPFYDPYPDPNYWVVRDSKEAAQMLQEELDKIDGRA